MIFLFSNFRKHFFSQFSSQIDWQPGFWVKWNIWIIFLINSEKLFFQITCCTYQKIKTTNMHRIKSSCVRFRFKMTLKKPISTWKRLIWIYVRISFASIVSGIKLSIRGNQLEGKQSMNDSSIWDINIHTWRYLPKLLNPIYIHIFIYFFKTYRSMSIYWYWMKRQTICSIYQ